MTQKSDHSASHRRFVEMTASRMRGAGYGWGPISIVDAAEALADELVVRGYLRSAPSVLPLEVTQ